METFKFRGTINRIEQTQTFGESGFKKRQVWVTEDNPDSKFENTVPFVVTHGAKDKYDDTEALDKFRKGDVIEFGFRPNGRIWKSKKDGSERCICDLKIFGKIEKVGGESAPEPATPGPGDVGDAGEDGMPF